MVRNKAFKNILIMSLAFALIVNFVRTNHIEKTKQHIVKTKCSIAQGKVYGCNVNVQNHKSNDMWTREMINVTSNDSTQKPKQRIKIAVLDSGIDLGNNIPFVEQKNFIEKGERSPFFVDDTGHGTSVAGLIAAEKNQTGISGIAQNVDLYSARVLSDDDSGDISNIVKALEWAIEKNVNIINMSFSTPQNYSELEQIVKKAYKKGILLIAAAGNNGKTEYPAAYPEVVSVGSVDSTGKVCEFSASSEEVELLAPGECVVTSGLLGGSVVLSGTSLSAPCVAGVAALLWSKYPDKDSSYIRALMDASANNITTDNKGYGIVDYQKALDICSDFEKKYINADKKYLSESEINKTVCDYISVYGENHDRIDVVNNNKLIYGQWQKHEDIVKEYSSITAFQSGGRMVDDVNELKGLNENHAWHGGMYSNYVADYRYLNKVARKVGNLGADAKLSEIQTAIKSINEVEGMSEADMTNIQKNSKKYKNTVFIQMKSDLVNYIAKKLVGKSGDYKEAYVFGIASHIATDAYAHATYRFDGSKWVYINHVKDSNGNFLTNDSLYADNIKCVSRRFQSAKQVMKKIVARYNGKSSNVAIIRDFQIEDAATRAENRQYYNPKQISYTKAIQNEDATYKMKKLKNYQSSAGEKDSTILAIYKEISQE